MALVHEDLKAGDVDVAFISAHTDKGSGVRGASRGPNDLRANGDVDGTWGAFSMPHMHTMVNPLDPISAECHASMTWMHRLKRVFNIDIAICERCAGHVRIIVEASNRCIEERVSHHCGDRENPGPT